MATYTYEGKFHWTSKSKKLGEAIPKSQVEPELLTNMENLAREKFNEELAKTGHWYNITGVSTFITVYDVKPEYNWQGQPLIGPNYYHFYTIEGTTIVTFDTDIPDAKLEFSPSLLAAIGIAIIAIAAAIIAHPLLFLAILLVIAFAILASQLTNVTTGLTNLIKEPAGAIMGIIGTVGVLILLLILLMWFVEPKIKARKGRRR